MTDLATQGHIRRATRLDGSAVFELRLAAYSGAPEFTINDVSSLQWSTADDNNIVLAAWDENDNAISTTRGDLLFNTDESEQWMECALERIPLTFPALLLGKGATLRTYEHHGFHSALRLCFVEASREGPIQSLIGIVYEDAPRTRLMRAIGYEFYAPVAYWYTDLEAHRRTLIAVLPRAKFATAATLLREKIGPLMSNYPCDMRELARHIDLALAGALGRSDFTR